MTNAKSAADAAAGHREAQPSLLSSARQWWLVACLSVVTMLAAVDRQLMALLVEPIKADLGLSDTQMSVLVGLSFALIYALAVIPAGYLADRWSRRGLIGAAALVWSAMTMVCGLASTHMQLFLARLGVGLSEGVVQPCAFSLARDGVAPHRHGRAFGLLSMSMLMGTGLAVLAGGHVVQYLERLGQISVPIVGAVKPWQAAFLIFGLAGAPFAALLATVTEPRRQVPRTGAGYGEAWAHVCGKGRLYGCIFGAGIASQLIGGAWGVWLPTLLQRRWGYAPAEIANSLGLLMIVGLPVGMWLSGSLMDRCDRTLGPWAAALVGAGLQLVLCVTGLLVPLVASPTLFWALLGLQVMIGAAPLSAAMVILAQVTPKALAGRVSSMMYLSMGIGGTALGPVIAAGLAETVYAHSGVRAIGYGLATHACAAGLLGAALLFGLAHLRRRGVGNLVEGGATG